MGCVKGKAVWKIVESVCQGVKQEVFRRHSENLRDRNFKDEDRPGTDNSDLNSFKYHRVKHRDEDTKFVLPSQLCLD